MPSPYTIAHGMRGVHRNTTTANAVDEIDWDRPCAQVKIINYGADDLHYTTDGSTPTVGGANTECLPKGVVGIAIEDILGVGNTKVMVVSATPVIYSVTGTL